MSVPGGVEDGVFSHRTRKGEEVVISHHGHPVATLRGKPAARFLARLQGLEDPEARLLMARTSGDFRRGNEHR